MGGGGATQSIMNNLKLDHILNRKEETPFDICKDIAYMVDQRSDKRTTVKFLSLTRGWSMHDLVMMREELPKRHPSHFWNKYNEIKNKFKKSQEV